MATITLTRGRHARTRFPSISLRISNSPFRLVPTEIFFLILEHAVLQCQPRSLALVSKAFRRVIDTILYRTVVLDSIETLQLFHRTTQCKKTTFFADHVLEIVVTNYNVASHPCLCDVIAACSGLRCLVLPQYKWPQNFLADGPAFDQCLGSFALRSLDPSNVANRHSTHLPPATGFSNLTHLRICEPADVWCSPSAMVEAFGPLPHLSHLQVARRANANQANDEGFALSISDLLASRPTLKMLVVSIFPGTLAVSGDTPVQGSEIWNRMREISDQRLILVPGRYEEWKDGWVDICAIRSGWRPVDYWIYTKRISNASINLSA